MNASWVEIFKTAFGPLLGAAIAIAAIWLRESFDKRRDAQTWFEQYYVVETLDKLIFYFSNIDLLLVELSTGTFKPQVNFASQLIAIDILPAEALGRTQLIIQSSVLTKIVIAVSTPVNAALSQESPKELFDDPLYRETCDHNLTLSHITLEHLTSLRKIFLALGIKSKADIYKIATRPEVSHLVKLMEVRRTVTEQHITKAISSADPKD